MNDIKELIAFSKTLKVLFIEDNEEVRVQLMKLLSNFFDNIDVANEGQSAFAKYTDYQTQTGNTYDLVVTDLSMPKVDGIELCKRILSSHPKQVILVISAHTEKEKLSELTQIGVYKILQKPVDYKELLDALENILMKIKTS